MEFNACFTSEFGDLKLPTWFKRVKSEEDLKNTQGVLVLTLGDTAKDLLEKASFIYPFNEEKILFLGALTPPAGILTEEVLMYFGEQWLRQGHRLVVFGASGLQPHWAYRVLEATEGSFNWGLASARPVEALLSAPSNTENARFAWLFGQEFRCSRQVWDYWFNDVHTQFFNLGKALAQPEEIEPTLRSLNALWWGKECLAGSSVTQKVTNPYGISPQFATQCAWWFGASKNARLLMVELPEDDTLNSLFEVSFLWYFFKGCCSQFLTDFTSEAILNYHVMCQGAHLLFCKDTHGLWWLHVEKEKNAAKRYFPCSEQDYLLAVDGQLTERIFRLL